MTAPKQLTRKVGPLPAWGWALAVIGGFVAYRAVRGRGGATTMTATGVPVTRSTSGYDTGATGAAAGSPADNSNSDLLSSLLSNQRSTYDALLAALQYGSAAASAGGSFGGSGATATAGGIMPAATAGSGTDTAATTAPTIDSGTNNAAPTAGAAQPVAYVGDTPVYPFIDPVSGAPIASPYTGSAATEPAIEIPGGGGGFYGVPTPSPTVAPTVDNPYIDAANPYTGSVATDPAIEVPLGGGGFFGTPTSTPTVVQPAPVDVSSVYDLSSGSPVAVGTTDTIRSAPAGKVYAT